MLRAVREKYKFNLVRIFPGWDYYNPAPGEYAFEDLEEVMGWCDEFGLRVLLGLVLETAPWWLEQAHPEARYVNAADRPRRLQGSGNNMTGGWPGLLPGLGAGAAGRGGLHSSASVIHTASPVAVCIRLLE